MSKLLWVYSHLKSDFFPGIFFLNRSSARGDHQKSLKSCLRTLSNVLHDMTEVFFCCQKSYGNTTRFKFFYTFFFSYRSGHIWPFRSKNFSVRSKTLQYNSIWLKKNNFCQKSYGKKTQLNFCYTQNLSKSCFILASICYYASLLHKVLMY